MSLFVNKTRGTASELLADLSACRQLKHLTHEDRHQAIADTFLWLSEAWMGRRATKHIDPTRLCESCGVPRSKFSAGSGLCFRCYATRGVAERELWSEDVFVFAISKFGFVCDACDETTVAQECEYRGAAARMLENMDGAVKPILCPACTKDFKSYASRNFGRGSWRTWPARDVEKIALGWFAQKLKVMAERRQVAA